MTNMDMNEDRDVVEEFTEEQRREFARERLTATAEDMVITRKEDLADPEDDDN